MMDKVMAITEPDSNHHGNDQSKAVSIPEATNQSLGKPEGSSTESMSQGAAPKLSPENKLPLPVGEKLTGSDGESDIYYDCTSRRGSNKKSHVKDLVGQFEKILPQSQRSNEETSVKELESQNGPYTQDVKENGYKDSPPDYETAISVDVCNCPYSIGTSLQNHPLTDEPSSLRSNTTGYKSAVSCVCNNCGKTVPDQPNTISDRCACGRKVVPHMTVCANCQTHDNESEASNAANSKTESEHHLDTSPRRPKMHRQNHLECSCDLHSSLHSCSHVQPARTCGNCSLHAHGYQYGYANEPSHVTCRGCNNLMGSIQRDHVTCSQCSSPMGSPIKGHVTCSECNSPMKSNLGHAHNRSNNSILDSSHCEVHYPNARQYARVPPHRMYQTQEYQPHFKHSKGSGVNSECCHHNFRGSANDKVGQLQNQTLTRSWSEPGTCKHGMSTKLTVMPNAHYQPTCQQCNPHIHKPVHSCHIHGSCRNELEPAFYENEPSNYETLTPKRKVVKPDVYCDICQQENIPVCQSCEPPPSPSIDSVTQLKTLAKENPPKDKEKVEEWLENSMDVLEIDKVLKAVNPEEFNKPPPVTDHADDLLHYKGGARPYTDDEIHDHPKTYSPPPLEPVTKVKNLHHHRSTARSFSIGSFRSRMSSEYSGSKVRRRIFSNQKYKYMISEDHSRRETGALDCILHIFNVIFLLISGATMGLAIWLLVKEFNIYQIVELFGNDQLKYVAFCAVAAGSVGILSSFCFCCGMREDRMGLGCYIFTLVIVGIVFATACIFAILFKSTLGSDNQKNTFKDRLITRYDAPKNSSMHNPFLTEAWDLMQTKFECCGAYGDGNSSTSWGLYKHKSAWIKRQKKGVHKLVPESCCTLEVETAICQGGSLTLLGPPLYGPPNHAPYNQHNQYLHTNGCLEKIMPLLTTILFWAVVALGVATGCAFLGVILAVILCTQIRATDPEDLYYDTDYLSSGDNDEVFHELNRITEEDESDKRKEMEMTEFDHPKGENESLMKESNLNNNIPHHPQRLYSRESDV